jgi:hypothetical protein
MITLTPGPDSDRMALNLKSTKSVPISDYVKFQDSFFALLAILGELGG